MECVKVVVVVEQGYESMVRVWDASVPSMGSPVFTSEDYHAAIGKLVASKWATDNLFKRGARAVKFEFLMK